MKRESRTSSAKQTPVSMPAAKAQTADAALKEEELAQVSGGIIAVLNCRKAGGDSN